jgi:hypothetical protein
MSIRSKMHSGAGVAVRVLATSLATQVAVQQTDINAISKRFDQLYTAGDYSAALIEAKNTRPP